VSDASAEGDEIEQRRDAVKLAERGLQLLVLVRLIGLRVVILHHVSLEHILGRLRFQVELVDERHRQRNA